MESIARVLTHRMVATKVEVVEAKLNAGQARYTRDSLAKVRDCTMIKLAMHAKPNCMPASKLTFDFVRKRYQLT